MSLEKFRWHGCNFFRMILLDFSNFLGSPQSCDCNFFGVIEFGYKFTSGNAGVASKKITLPHYMIT